MFHGTFHPETLLDFRRPQGMPQFVIFFSLTRRLQTQLALLTVRLQQLLAQR